MVYCTEFDRPTTAGVTFDYIVPTYRYNNVDDVLVEDGTVDLHELVQSSLMSALDRKLAEIDKFSGVEDDTVVDAVSDVQDKLDLFRRVYADKADFSERYGIDPRLSFDEYFARLNELLVSSSKKQNMEVKIDDEASVKEA